MNNSWARPGVKCVCIDADDRAGQPDGKFITSSLNSLETHLVAGAIYTVRDTMLSKNGSLGLRLKEISLPLHTGVECGWWADRFRPLAYPEQSIEHDVALFVNAPAHAPDLESERA